MTDFIKRLRPSLSKMPETKNIYIVFASILLLAISLFYLLTLRPGFRGSPDTALYLMHAKNIAEGVPYGATHYLFNPLNSFPHPAAYPPGLPLLLAPLYAVFGLDPEPMKIEMIICFIASLCTFLSIARNYLSPGLTLAATAVVGFNSYIWGLRDSIISEYPFMLFCFFALLTVCRLQEQTPTSPSRPLLILLAAIFLALAEETRSIGILLLPSILVAAVLRLRSKGRMVLWDSAVVAGLATAAIIVFRLLFPADSGTYLRNFEDYSLYQLLSGIITYLRVGFSPFQLNDIRALGGVAHILVPAALLLGIAGFILATYGFIKVALPIPSVAEVFAACYFCFLVVYPVRAEPMRFAMPILPMLFLYQAIGLCAAVRQLGDGMRHAILIVYGGLLLVTYSAAYAGANSVQSSASVWSRSPSASPYQELIAVIRSKTPSDTVLIADDPATVGLFADRKSAIWPSDYRSRFWDYVNDIGATYVVHYSLERADKPFPNKSNSISMMVYQFLQSRALLRSFAQAIKPSVYLEDAAITSDNPGRHADLTPLEGFDQFLVQNSDYLQPVFNNEWFVLYRIIGRPG